MSKVPSRIYRFRVSLNEIEPRIWRLIDVPERYSFWDLHVAIQDSMGWLDYHLHSFNPPRKPGGIKAKIGILGAEFVDQTVEGWDVPISNFFMDVGDSLEYEYDFGDSWSHEVILVGILLKKDPKLKYPQCVDGQRACPPEDHGGVGGYEQLLDILADSSNAEY